MEPRIAGELRMESGDEHGALPAQDGMSVDTGEHLDVWPDLFDEWRPDEHGVERCIESLDVEIRLEGVDLPTEGVASHGDVDDAEAALIGSAVEHVAGEQDHPGTGAERRHPVGKSFRDRIT